MTPQVHSIDPEGLRITMDDARSPLLGLLIIGLDNTILNVALTSLQDQLGAEGSALQWIVDRFGRRARFVPVAGRRSRGRASPPP